MQYSNPKIKFYKIRTFGEKFNAVFDFLRETWKPMLKFSLYVILPICLIQSFALTAYTRISFSLSTSGYSGADMSSLISLLMNYGLYMICMLVGSCMLSALVYTLMQEYERRENRLMGITMADFKETLIRNFWKMAKASLFFGGMTFLIMLFVGILAYLSLWTLVITSLLLLIGLLVVIIPITFFSPLYMFEDIPFFDALRKSFKYGFSAWGEIFAVMFVFLILGGIISGITMMPWYIMVLIKGFFTMTNEGNNITSSWLYDFIVYLFGIVQSYGAYVASIMSVVGIAFQYFHTREKKEGLSVNESISNFDQL